MFLMKKYMKAYGAAVYVASGPHGRFMAIPSKVKSEELYKQIKSIPRRLYWRDKEMKKTIESAIHTLEYNLLH